VCLTDPHADLITLADLDLTVPLTPDKSPFPTVIVTPANPISATDFAFAFIPPKPKPTLRERAKEVFSAVKPDTAALPVLPAISVAAIPAVIPVRARTSIFVFLLFFIMACHLFAHQLASRRPHLHFALPTDQSDVLDIGAADADAHSGFFGLGAILSAARTDPKRDFIVAEPSPSPDAASVSSDATSL
jgi:hypothetical protein